MSFDLTQHEVGDEFEGSPSELSVVISAILSEGGSFYYEGKSIVITSLPQRKTEKKEPVKEESVKEETVKEETVKEESVKEEPAKEESVKETDEDPETVVAPKPKTRARKIYTPKTETK